MTMTYNDKTKHGNLATDSGWTYGGYSKSHTANQRLINTYILNMFMNMISPGLLSRFLTVSPWKLLVLFSVPVSPCTLLWLTGRYVDDG